MAKTTFWQRISAFLVYRPYWTTCLAQNTQHGVKTNAKLVGSNLKKRNFGQKAQYDIWRGVDAVLALSEKCRPLHNSAFSRSQIRAARWWCVNLQLHCRVGKRGHAGYSLTGKIYVHAHSGSEATGKTSSTFRVTAGQISGGIKLMTKSKCWNT